MFRRLAAAICLTACAHATPSVTPCGDVAETASISGVVSGGDDLRLENTLVVIEGTALSQPVEVYTNANGLFVVKDLPPGVYTVHFLRGDSDRTRTVRLAPGSRFRTNIRLYPTPFLRCIVCDYGGLDRSLFTDTKRDAELLRRPRAVRYL